MNLYLMPMMTFIGIHYFSETLLSAVEKTHITGITMTVCTMFCLMLNYMLIPELSWYGAVIASNLSFFIVAIILFFIGISPVHTPGVTEHIVLIGNADIEDSLTSEDVKQIFLGRKTRWHDDSTITFVLFNDNTATPIFLKEYVKKTPFQYKNFWKKQVFTGKGRMPKSFKHPEDVIEPGPGPVYFFYNFNLRKKKIFYSPQSFDNVLFFNIILPLKNKQESVELVSGKKRESQKPG